ncbi:hypothetical protein C0Q70_03365 [Pomacea canaliculata]|uniref:Fibronectin type-III domain-containing protein n=1 Tax=Pomacea canaliculata TaxID=400727 RepID=A0A2T7PSH7_POMCA|nr:hypothetical protein C0Q70_03365 [Pomacea canaliculata]
MLVIAATSGARKLPPSPKKLQVRTISQHAIKVKWHDPGRLKDDGSRFYSVRYSAAGQEEKPKFVQTQEKRVRVSKLQPNTTYVFASRPWWASRAAPGAPPPLPPQGSRVSSKVVNRQHRQEATGNTRVVKVSPAVVETTVAEQRNSGLRHLVGGSRLR